MTLLALINCGNHRTRQFSSFDKRHDRRRSLPSGRVARQYVLGLCELAHRMLLVESIKAESIQPLAEESFDSNMVLKPLIEETGITSLRD